jgi:hypothetical protein
VSPISNELLESLLPSILRSLSLKEENAEFVNALLDSLRNDLRWTTITKLNESVDCCVFTAIATLSADTVIQTYLQMRQNTSDKGLTTMSPTVQKEDGGEKQGDSPFNHP